MSTATPRPVRRFSVDDVARMVEAGILGADKRVELIDGELIVMPLQGPEHADIKRPSTDHRGGPHRIG